MVRIKFYGLFTAAISLFVAVTLWFAVTPVNPASSSSPALRPTVNPGDNGSDGNDGNGVDGNGGNGNGNGGPFAANCGLVTGQVINWGFGPQEGVGVELKTGSWQTSATSASDGNYSLAGLGIGVARLEVALAPGLAGELDPAIQTAGVYLSCNFPTIANLAVSGSVIDPPATIEMSGPTTLTADSSVPLRLTVENDLPNDITNVIVTDLLPSGLIALEVDAAAVDESDARIIDARKDGQLVVVYLDRLTAGAETNIFITVTVAEEVPANTRVTNTATLFYRESVAAQASLDLTISGIPLPGPAASVAGREQLDQDAAAETEAEDSSEETSVPPAEAPTTGGELLPATAKKAGTEDGLVLPEEIPITGGEIKLVEAETLAGKAMAGQPLLVGELADGTVAIDDRLAGGDTSIDPDSVAETGPPSPVTFISALLLLAVLIGLGGLSFLTHRARFVDENLK